MREVTEETGLAVRITESFDSIEYAFTQNRTRIHKTVHYFLMEAVGGDLARHDHEFEEVRWVDLPDALGLLTFETEKDLVNRAAQHVTASEPVAGKSVGRGSASQGNPAGTASPPRATPPSAPRGTTT